LGISLSLVQTDSSNSSNNTFALAATAPGGTVTFSSCNTSVLSIGWTTATEEAKGATTLTATHGGNANYNSATATKSVTV